MISEKKKLLTSEELKMRMRQFMLQQILKDTEDKPDGQFAVLDSARNELRETEEGMRNENNKNQR